jgi:DNA polymerase
MGTLLDDIVTVLENEKKVNPLTAVSADVLNELYGIEQNIQRNEHVPHLAETQNIATPPQQQNRSQQSTSQTVAKQEMTSDVGTLDYAALKTRVMGCQLCNISQNRNNVLFGVGNPNADLMFIGGMPGYEEDAKNSLFAGQNGEILLNMIKAMKFTSDDVYVTNLMKCYPRTLHPDMGDVGRCTPYVKREIELVNPKVIVLFGAGPLRFLLGKSNLEECRGKWDSFMGIRTIVTYPIALIARPENKAKKRMVWNDLQLAMKALGV